MISITKGAANSMIVTATENATAISVVLVAEFTHIQTGQVKCFHVTNSSSYTYRYDKFTFTEGSNASKTLREGQHTYRIIGQDVLNTTAGSYEPDGIHYELLEQGIAMVKDTDTAATAYEPTETATVYEP